MGRWRGATVGVLVGLLGGALRPAVAPAAVYHAYSCHTPQGEVAPSDGWSATTNGFGAYAIDDCAGRTTSALTAELDGQVAHPGNQSSAVWTFTAAPYLSLAGATLYRHEAVPGGAGPGSSYVTSFDAPNLVYDAADVFDNCQANLGCAERGTGRSGFDPSNRVVVPASYIGGAAHLFMGAGCGGQEGRPCPTWPGYAAEAELYAADLTLRDDVAPVAASVGGPLVSPGTLTGPADIWFRAYDQGSGVYSAALSLDGQAVSTQVLDENGGRCKAQGQAGDGLRDFRYQVPCKSAVSADLTLDTSRIRDGSHALQVSVDDAAGNVTSVYSATITTRNAPQGGVPQVTGILAQGQRLAANPGTWSPAPSAFGFQWLRCDASMTGCHAIPGAVEQTYVPVGADVYQRLAVDLTASDAGGSTTIRSAAVGPIADQSGGTTGAAGGPIQAQAGGLTGASRPASGSGPGHAANGAGACGSPRLTASFGSGPVGHVGLPGRATLHGLLACAGRPVGGAAIEVSITRTGDGGGPRTAELRTSRGGSFALVLTPGPSRALRLSYRAFSDAAAPAASVSARLEVRPSIGLSIHPARARNGQTITYRGRVLGGLIPGPGLALEVQYRDGRRWRTFDQTRARARDGRFVYRYTFRRTTIPIRYTFRIAIPAGGVSDYPYASTWSRPRSVRVTP